MSTKAELQVRLDESRKMMIAHYKAGEQLAIDVGKGIITPEQACDTWVQMEKEFEIRMKHSRWPF